MHQFHTFDKEIYLSFSTKSIPKESEVASVILFHLLGWNRKKHKKRHRHTFNGSEYKLSWKKQDHPPTLLGLEASSSTLAILKAADTMFLQSCPKLTEMAKNCPPGKLTLRFEGNTRVKLILGVWDGYFWISTLVEFHYLRFLWYFDSSRKWKSAEQQLKLLLQSIIIYLVPD